MTKPCGLLDTVEPEICPLPLLVVGRNSFHILTKSKKRASSPPRKPHNSRNSNCSLPKDQFIMKNEKNAIKLDREGMLKYCFFMF